VQGAAEGPGVGLGGQQGWVLPGPHRAGFGSGSAQGSNSALRALLRDGPEEFGWSSVCSGQRQTLFGQISKQWMGKWGEQSLGLGWGCYPFEYFPFPLRNYGTSHTGSSTNAAAPTSSPPAPAGPFGPVGWPCCRVTRRGPPLCLGQGQRMARPPGLWQRRRVPPDYFFSPFTELCTHYCVYIGR